MAKTFRIPAHEIRAIAPDRGGCIASDRITVDGERVGFMYREQPNDDVDSGWRFFAGNESQEYTDNPSRFAIYDVNTIASYDVDVVAQLDAQVGAAFERHGAGPFVAAAFQPPEEG